MKTQRGLIVRMAVPVLSLVTLGILSPAASSHGDLGLSSQPNALSAAFTRPVVDQKVAFTVHVRNAAGEPVSAAHVNVYIGSFFNRRPGNVIPRPAPYQKETDSKGIASFDIDVPAGATHLYISVEVSREDLSTERAETDLLTDPAIKRGEPIEIKLVPKDEKDAIYGGAEVVNVVFDVHDADDEANPIEGATVRVGGDMIHPPAVVTGADGKATVKVPILNATTSLNAFADKNGYKPLKDLSFKLSWGQRGKTVEGGILILKKIPGAATNIKVAIHVQDD
ncbi:MAG TPA: Ig-like domain-containing protein, partial [Pyrinomonadaceae bacterium]|nr:Ig-like domain-containing protein [Pyrinomonadaceae bacterium]